MSQPIPMDGLTLRSLDERDIDGVFQIESSVYEDPWTEDLLRQSLTAPMTHTLGFFEGERCLAYSIFQLVLSEGHLLNLAVSKECQGRGLGKKLLSEVLNYGRDQGVASFFLEVRPSNESAKKLYEQFGFRTLFIRDRYYSNGESAVVMTLDL